MGLPAWRGSNSGERCLTSTEREPTCLNRPAEWHTYAVYVAVGHPLARSLGEPHAASDKGYCWKDRAERGALVCVSGERSRAGERAPANRCCHVRRRLLLVRGSGFRQG